MEITFLSIDVLITLFFVAVFAGFVDTLVGGGGLITVPSLILAGVPPIMALGTNKLQGCMGTCTSSLMMIRKRKIQWQTVKWMALYAFAGAALGTLTLQVIPSATLSFIIPLILLVIAGYFLFAANIHVNNRPARLNHKVYQRTFIPVIGFYDGFFGPGTGSFFSLAGVALRGQDLLQATAIAKALNFATNIASLLIFIAAGSILWSAGLVMMVGQIIGAWLGAHSLFRVPVELLRVLIVLVSLGMLVRYLMEGNFI